MKDECLTVKQLATHLNVGEVTIRRMERNGVIPGMRFGRCLRFDPDDVMAFKKSMKVIKKTKAKR